MIAVRSVVYVEELGIENLTTTFGLTNLMLGTGVAIGTPLLGMFKEYTGSYEYTLLSSGLLFVASGVFHFILPVVKKWESSKIKTPASVETE